MKPIILDIPDSGCYQNPVSSNPVFYDLESGFSIVESGFLKRESEHESGFFPSPGFLRVRVRVRVSKYAFVNRVSSYSYISSFQASTHLYQRVDVYQQHMQEIEAKYA